MKPQYRKIQLIQSPVLTGYGPSYKLIDNCYNYLRIENSPSQVSPRNLSIFLSQVKLENFSRSESKSVSHVVKFDGTNYQYWKFEITLALELHDLLE